MASIKAVAEKAGMSESSVSRILNGLRKANRPSSQRRVERVLKIAADLGYQPNAAARAMRTRRSHHIGVLVCELYNPATGMKVEAIERVLAKRGYHMLLGLTEAAENHIDQYLKTFSRGLVDGVINLDPYVETHHLKSVVQEIPSVAFARNEQASPAQVDYVGGMTAALDHLWSLGHRRIALVTGPRQDKGSLLRINGFENYFSSRGVELISEQVIVGSWQMENGEKAVPRILQNGLTAVVAANDLIAIGVLRGLAQLGRTCPADLSIVGYDSTLLTELAHPQLTTLETPVQEMAELTVETLLAQIEGSKVSEPHIFTPRLVIRQSAARLTK